MKTALYKLSHLSIIAFGFFALIPFKYRGALFVILFLSTILLVLRERKFTFTKEALVNSSTYLLFIICLVYVNDLSSGFKKLETMLSLLLIPLLFSNIWNLNKNIFTKTIFNRLIQVFYFSTFVYSLILFLSFFLAEEMIEETNTNFFFQALRYLTINKGDHPIYISAILTLAILFSFELIKNKSTKRKTAYIILNLIMLSLILIYAKRSVIIAFFLASLVYFSLGVSSSKKKKMTLTLLTITLFFTVFFIPTTKARFSETLNSQGYQEIKESNSTSHRFHIYKCSFEVFKESPLIGYGIGDDRIKLLECYETHYTENFNAQKYNTHNQYLGILLKTGIIGLIIFIAFLYYNYKIAIKSNDIMYLSFLILFSVIMLFENVLERQNGVMLFAFFINYFAHRNKINRF